MSPDCKSFRPFSGLLHRRPTKYSEDCEETVDEEMLEYFPPLEKHVVVDQSFGGFNPKSFFNIFFSDGALHSLKSFHIQRGDKELSCGKWQNVTDWKPFRPDNGGRGRQEIPCNAIVLERHFSFRTKTKNKFGSSSARVRSLQRVTLMDDNDFVFESKNTFENLPFSNCFCVWSCWKVDSSIYFDEIPIDSPQFQTETTVGVDREFDEADDLKRKYHDRSEYAYSIFNYDRLLPRLKGLVGQSVRNMRKSIWRNVQRKEKVRRTKSLLNVSVEVEMLDKSRFEIRIRSTASKMFVKYLNSWLDWAKSVDPLMSNVMDTETWLELVEGIREVKDFREDRELEKESSCHRDIDSLSSDDINDSAFFYDIDASDLTCFRDENELPKSKYHNVEIVYTDDAVERSVSMYSLSFTEPPKQEKGVVPKKSYVWLYDKFKLDRLLRLTKHGILSRKMKRGSEMVKLAPSHSSSLLSKSSNDSPFEENYVKSAEDFLESDGFEQDQLFWFMEQYTPDNREKNAFVIKEGTLTDVTGAYRARHNSSDMGIELFYNDKDKESIRALIAATLQEMHKKGQSFEQYCEGEDIEIIPPEYMKILGFENSNQIEVEYVQGLSLDDIVKEVRRYGGDDSDCNVEAISEYGEACVVSLFTCLEYEIIEWAKQTIQ
uniref:VASt domain-containing protein n=1 Tax=Corethron hystrix TaxID=216773 RepID=A0A7S1B6G9_9STRA|mmetsp:Transcript_14839/g.32901  ORF Transcript_14839/g.32901 Transcript_14839/m.32901 type:complete len:659 (+) Transcript_14839:391-2367(+)